MKDTSATPSTGSWPKRSPPWTCSTAATKHAVIPGAALDTTGLSADQATAVTNMAISPWLIQPLQAPAGAGKTHCLKALRDGAHRVGKRILVLSPTGKGVDVAMRKNAGDEGHTIARALLKLRNGTLTLDHKTVVIVDEAGMLGTPQMRELLDATTQAGAKTLLVGDPHQLSPVKARGGMFDQICTDAPWAQRLSEVWRIRDPQEKAASLALRHGGPKPLRRAIAWYRDHNRLHTGDQITMAADALAAYRADRDAGKDSLLICDTWEMADALNRRLHDERVSADTPTVVADRGHRVSAGDTIITRRNDYTIATEVLDTDGVGSGTADPVRNGNRWTVTAVDAQRGAIAARRHSDGARAAFGADYYRGHIAHGYATTVHPQQGADAQTCHLVAADTTTAALLYTGMTRGAERNTVYLYQRLAGEADHEHAEALGVHIIRRGTAHEAADLLHHAVSRRDAQRPCTVHEIGARTDRSHLPKRVASLLERHDKVLTNRRMKHRTLV